MIRRDIRPGYEYLGLEGLTRPLLFSASLYTLAKSNPVPFHATDAYELHYVHTGHLTREFEDGSILHIRGGDVSVIQPNTRHHSLHDADTPSVFLALCVVPHAPSPSLPFASPLEQTCALSILRRAGNRVVRGCPGLDGAFHTLRNEARRIAVAAPERKLSAGQGSRRQSFDQTPAGEAQLRGLLHQVFLYMLRSLAEPVHGPHYASVKRAMRYIDENLGEYLPAHVIARATGLSRGRLHALFHAEVGESPSEYVLHRRIERAMDLLRNSDRSIIDIAIELGFSTSQNFSRSFRTYFGFTPTAWRQQAQAEKAGGTGTDL